MQRLESSLINRSNSLVQKIESLEKREKLLNYKEKELENNIQKTNDLYQEQRNELI